MSDPKIVVYTAISAGYDNLVPPHPLWQKQAQFVAFLDKKPPGDGWDWRPIWRRFRDPCRNAKIHKILPHRFLPDAEYSLWIDGSVSIVSRLPLSTWIDRYLRDHDLAVFKHPRRNCIYNEAYYCMMHGFDSQEVINRQMQKYFEHGHPTDGGLAECTVLLRRHTKAMARFNEAWYEEIKRHSRRDQLSFNYVARRLKFQFAHLPGRMNHTPHFVRVPHLRQRTAPAQMRPLAAGAPFAAPLGPRGNRVQEQP